MGQHDNQRGDGNQYLTGQEVSYQEILDIVSNRSRDVFIGDNDTF